MATQVQNDELSELASFVAGLASTVARDADRLRAAAALIRRKRPEELHAMTDAALPELRHCCRCLIDCTFRLRSAIPHSDLEPDDHSAAPGGDAT